MSEQPESRIAAARKRVADAKQTLVVGAVAAFVAVAGLAWASHPGESSASSNSTSTTSGDEGLFLDEEDDDFGGFDSFGSIAPSGGSAPQVQAHVS